MLKIKVYDTTLINEFYNLLNENYTKHFGSKDGFKFIEYNDIGTFIFTEYDPIEVIYENLLKNYAWNGKTYSIKIKRNKRKDIIVKIKPFDYEENHA